MSIASAVQDFGKVALVAGAGMGGLLLAGCAPSQKITPLNQGRVLGGALGGLTGALLAQNSDSGLVSAIAPAAGVVIGTTLGSNFDRDCIATPSGRVSEGSGRRPTWERDTDIDCNPVGGTMADFNMNPRLPPDTGRRNVVIPHRPQQAYPQQQPVYQQQPVTQTSLGYGQNANGAFWGNDGQCQMEVFDGRVITVAPEACR